MSDAKAFFDEVRGGRRPAWEKLWSLYEDRIRKLVVSRLKNHMSGRISVDDVLQETVLRSIQALKRVEWRGEEALFGWFCGVALNVLRESERRYLRISDVVPWDVQCQDNSTPSRLVQREERFQRLQESLESLTDEQREIVCKVRLEGLTVRQAAAQMDRSEKAAYQLLWRAIRKMKKRFGDTASLRLPDRRLEGEAKNHAE